MSVLQTQLCLWIDPLSWRFNLHFHEFKARQIRVFFLVYNTGKAEEHMNEAAAALLKVGKRFLSVWNSR